MKLLVTGAAGFIGGHLVDRFLVNGHEVIGIDNLSLGTLRHLDKALQNPSFHFIQADINEMDTIRPMLKGKVANGSFDMLWHLAANSDISAGVADPKIDLQNTFLTSFNALQLAREFDIPRFAFASTSAVYGNRDTILVEDSGPMLPISNYGAMKLASEASISAAVESGLKQAWIFRFPNVIGPRATHGALYDFVKRLRADSTQLSVLGNGTQQKPYLHVFELIEAMIFITQNASDRLNYFNIGPESDGTTVQFIAETAVSLVSPKAIIRYGTGSKGWIGDVPKFNYSIEKLKKLGWSPKLNSNQAVERALEEIAAEK